MESCGLQISINIHVEQSELRAHLLDKDKTALLLILFQLISMSVWPYGGNILKSLSAAIIITPGFEVEDHCERLA